ncbi:hypothetical protein HE1_00024 [Holospora elegans E1]|uniref:Uncharacterized protein n=1 Tax=Holospora elegans E1 TaxID=1427503 RepID=A0A023DXQ8_9PROT|nr:hypothetical protein [Holospora elegans]GAJ45715.1 hypothetical protein HE1_00024 [Holospora elegans E1]
MRKNDIPLKTDYTCLQDIMDEIYNWPIHAKGGAEQEHWMEFLPKFAVKEDILKSLERYFDMWDLGERGVDYLEEISGFLECERASWCVYYLFKSLVFLKDPSFIPFVMKYFPSAWCMEGMWFQPMINVITNYHRWGASYIPWVMRSLHLLPSGALNDAAGEFMFNMMFDTFYHITPDVFPDLSVVDALPLGKRDIVLTLVKNEVLGWQESLKRAKEKLEKASCEKKINDAKKSIDSAKKSLACAEYVLGQLLLLPEEVIGIGHR